MKFSPKKHCTRHSNTQLVNKQVSPFSSPLPIFCQLYHATPPILGFLFSDRANNNRSSQQSDTRQLLALTMKYSAQFHE